VSTAHDVQEEEMERMVSRFRVLVLVMALALTAVSATPAFARGSGGGGGKGGGYTGTFSLVLLNSTDGLPHWGQQVTFNVSSTAPQPNVSLNCYQNAVLVYGAVAGFYPGYPWPWDQTFTLSSPSWTGGAASCTATLYYLNGKTTVTMATMNFQVYA
jgi:hypothetical protein